VKCKQFALIVADSHWISYARWSRGSSVIYYLVF